MGCLHVPQAQPVLAMSDVYRYSDNPAVAIAFGSPYFLHQRM